ncbi:hypothetical protein [Shimia thalassica]
MENSARTHSGGSICCGKTISVIEIWCQM